METAETVALSVGETAYARIRSDIVFGTIEPGQKLRLDRMKQDYEVGVGTLREILSRLAAEGLVVAEGQRGFEAAPVTAENFREIAALRLLLEGHALALSFAEGDMEWEGRVVAAQHKLRLMEQRMLKGEEADTRLWKRYDWEFHQALISACGSRELMQAHAIAFDKYLRYQMVAVTFRGEVAAQEHVALRDSALERDSQRAIEILTRHINDCVEFTLASGAIR